MIVVQTMNSKIVVQSDFMKQEQAFSLFHDDDDDYHILYASNLARSNWMGGSSGHILMLQDHHIDHSRRKIPVTFNILTTYT